MGQQEVVIVQACWSSIKLECRKCSWHPHIYMLNCSVEMVEASCRSICPTSQKVCTCQVIVEAGWCGINLVKIIHASSKSRASCKMQQNRVNHHQIVIFFIKFINSYKWWLPQCCVISLVVFFHWSLDMLITFAWLFSTVCFRMGLQIASPRGCIIVCHIGFICSTFLHCAF